MAALQRGITSPSRAMAIAAETTTPSFESHDAPPAALEPIDSPETYQELHIVLGILGNGTYGQKRIELMERPDNTFDRVKVIERRLLLSLSGSDPADDLTDEHRQDVRQLFLLMGVPGAEQGSVTHRLRIVGDWVRRRVAGRH